MWRKNVEKFHSLHLEAKIAVNHEQDYVCNLCNVDHGIDVVGAFDKGEAAFLASDDGDGSENFREGVLGVSTDK